MSAITDFTNKWFSTSNRVHKMFHETTISLHSLQLHWITILLLAEITAFVFIVATKFVFVSETPSFLGEEANGVPLSHTLYSEWHGLGAHLALPKRWWCTPKKSSRWLAPSPLCSQALLSCRKPSNSPLSTQDIWERSHMHALRSCIWHVLFDSVTSCKERGWFWLIVSLRFWKQGRFWKSTKWEPCKWQMKEARHSLLPVTVSLNLHPVLACQTPSQMVTLNMAVNSQWAASLPYSW